jgi:hypothetical protein
MTGCEEDVTVVVLATAIAEISFLDGLIAHTTNILNTFFLHESLEV